MSRKLLLSFQEFVVRIEQLFWPHQFPPPALVCVPSCSINLQKKTKTEESFDGFLLWAVPKHRRTVEKRLNRKFGYPEFFWKPLKKKSNLRSCTQCGHDHEIGILCPHCYDKVRQETKLMQERIQQELRFHPVEQDVIVLYEGDRTENLSESLKGKHVVEMKKLRPMWFTKNLLQKTSQSTVSDDSKKLKPTNLG